MPHLIDGYNLIHAMGVLRDRTGPTGLEKARLRLLGLLAGALGDRAGEVTVVFDAAGAPPDAAGEYVHQGIRVCYAVRRADADELIEDLIRADSAPKRLTVVSDDHRVQAAARRRQCTALGCAGFLSWLDRQRQARRSPPDPDAKPTASSAGETADWLKEFGHLDDDPDFKSLADPREFFDDD